MLRMKINSIYNSMFLIWCMVVMEPHAALAQSEIRLTNKVYTSIVCENNYQLMAASAMVDAANTNVDVVRKDLLPLFDFSLSDRYFDERVTPEGLPTVRNNFYNLGFNLSQNLYSGGMVQKNKKLAEIYAKEAAAGRDFTENEILHLANITYWTAISAKEELGIWIEYRKRFKRFYNTIEDRVNEAIVGKNELLTTKVQLNEIDLQILNTEKTAEVAVLNLKRLAGLPVDGEVVLLDSIIINESLPDTSNVFQLALQNRPEVQQLRQQVLASEQKEKMAAAKYAPSFSVSLGGNYSSGLIEEKDGDFHYNVLAKASVPITRWGKKRDEKSMQKYYTKSANDQLQDMEVNIRYDIEKAYYNLQQSIRQVNLSREAAQDARDNLQIYIDRYDEGLSSIVEVTEAQIFLQQALVLLFTYRTNYQFSLIEYDRALGNMSQ